MHNVNILYLIIDVPTDNADDTIVPRCGERVRKKPVTSRAEAVSLCGLIALFNDDGGCIFFFFLMPGSSSANLRRGGEDFKTKYSSSRRRHYYVH